MSEMMQEWMKLPSRQAIVEAKTFLLGEIPDLEARMRRMTEWISDEVASIRNEGGEAVPQIEFRDLAHRLIDDSMRARIRRRGCVVIRGVFDRHETHGWNAEIGRYIDANGYLAKAASRAGLDQYFTGLASSRPQIYGLYWSRPQIEARQHKHMASAREFLNGLWNATREDGSLEFDPGRQCDYADRLRRREPGDRSFGLSPHCDGGSIERWCDPGYREIYREVFFGRVEDYDPFRADGRTRTAEIPSPAVCSAFRTFQGWTALTPQGPGDGTLQLVPIANSMAWLLLRALQPDVPEDELCGATAGRALAIDSRWHQPLRDAFVSIPRVEPGDTVWWHPDLIHSVEELHRGTGYSNVIYIGAAPWCTKNERYLSRQAESFLSGRSAPDFAAEDYEVDFIGRARPDDLTARGLRQMGLEKREE